MPITAGNIPVAGGTSASSQAMALGGSDGLTTYGSNILGNMPNGTAQLRGSWFGDLNNYQNNPDASAIVQGLQNGTLTVSNGQLMSNGQPIGGLGLTPEGNGQYNVAFNDAGSGGTVDLTLGTGANGQVTANTTPIWTGGAPSSGLGGDLLAAGALGAAAFTGGTSLGLLGGAGAAAATGGDVALESVAAGDLGSILPGAVSATGAADTLAPGLAVGGGSFGADAAIPTTLQDVGATQSLASTLPGAVGGAGGAGAASGFGPLIQQLGETGGAIKTGLGALSVAEGLYGIGAASRANSTNNSLIPQVNSLGPYSQQAASQLMALQANPSSVTSTPGYKAGLEAVEQSDAAKGTFGSGNTLLDLQNYGQQAYQQQFNNLMSIATGGSQTAASAAGVNNSSSANYMAQLTQALQAFSFGGSLLANGFGGVNAANNNPSNSYSPTGSY